MAGQTLAKAISPPLSSPSSQHPHLVRPHTTPAGSGPRGGRGGNGDAGGEVYIGIEQVGLM